MSISPGTRKDPTGEINVTPLIDVLLVLLIIFMVIVPQRSMGELAQIPQPPVDSRQADPPAPIVIQVKDAGRGILPALELNRQPVSWSDLEARLEGICRERSDRSGFILGDSEVEFGAVADLLDLAHRAGMERIGLVREFEGMRQSSSTAARSAAAK